MRTLLVEDDDERVRVVTSGPMRGTFLTDADKAFCAALAREWRVERGRRREWGIYVEEQVKPITVIHDPPEDGSARRVLAQIEARALLDPAAKATGRPQPEAFDQPGPLRPVGSKRVEQHFPGIARIR